MRVPKTSSVLRSVSVRGVASSTVVGRPAVTASRSHPAAEVASAPVTRSIPQGLPTTIRNPPISTPTSTPSQKRGPSNRPMAFPCLDVIESRNRSYDSGPEPTYSRNITGYEVFHSSEPLRLDNGGILLEYDIAYETWGTLNADRSNAVLLHTGLSASSHAHSTAKNPAPGWWEKFIGPGCAVDTDKFFVICTNVIGGCYGSSGPSSVDPSDGQRYATRFPILTIDDMTRAQQRLIQQQLGIQKLHASVGASMGGMQSLSYGAQFTESVGRIVSISGCARSHPYSVAMRHTQRQALMSDPNWQRGFYYDSVPPHAGMKLAREIATITYRSGPEWEQRFGRKRADPTKPPALCADFLIETYLDHQGEKFCLEYDPNSLLYVSKAMDLFDMSLTMRERAIRTRTLINIDDAVAGGSCALPRSPYEEVNDNEGVGRQLEFDEAREDLVAGMRVLKNTPVFVLGVESDILFPSWQQKEIADCLTEAGNKGVEHVELSSEVSWYGHDTFLLSLSEVGGPVKKFLEKDI
ncbi:Alpha/Beta hydrolase protein [Lipomyces oligophaga]|uniref:Alpha/Beta hydrolase protein n=1 Tax=Lipomyces oligophaga TaxID=45792 RepID=UPI0034CFB5AF